MSGSLPPGWVTAPLSSLVSGKGVMCDGDWVESKDQDPNGDVRLVQLADVGNGTFVDKSDRYLTSARARELNCTFLEAGDLLISRLGEPLGKSCLFPELDRRCVTVVDVHIFRSGHSDISHGWLVHFLNSPSIRREVDALSSGTTRKRITGQRLKDLEIPLPPSQEQGRIVSKIDELFSDIEEGERALARVQKLVERYRQSVLKAAVTGELTREWREQRKPKLESGAALLARILKARRAAWEQAELDKMKAKSIRPADDKWKEKYREPPVPDTSELPKLPDEWVWASVDFVSDSTKYALSSGPFGSSLGTKDYRRDGVPVLRGQNIQAGKIVENNFVYIDNDKALELQRSIAVPEDLVVIAVGSSGRSAVIPHTLSRVVLSQNCNKVTCNQAIVIPQYLNLYLQSGFGQERIAGKTTDTVRKFFSLTNFRAIAVPLMSLEEQAAVVSTIDSQFAFASQVLSDMKAVARLSAALSQSVLKAAFSGALVAQHPGDEPASVLLERIAAERALSAIAAKPSRKAKPRKG